VIRQQSDVRHHRQSAFTHSRSNPTSTSNFDPLTTSGHTAINSNSDQVSRNSAAEQLLRRSKLGAEGARLRDQTAALSNDPAGQNALALSKVALLKAWLREMPEKSIPEIQFCTDADWLDVVQWAALDHETGARKALLGIRNLAKRRFEETVISAVNKYSEAH